MVISLVFRPVVQALLTTLSYPQTVVSMYVLMYKISEILRENHVAFSLRCRTGKND